MQRLAQKSGVPQSVCWGGSQTAAVCAMPSMQLEVRQ